MMFASVKGSIAVDALAEVLTEAAPFLVELLHLPVLLSLSCDLCQEPYLPRPIWNRVS